MPAGRIYWVKAPFAGRVAVVARPREASCIGLLKSAGISTLVSLLEAGEADDVGLSEEAAWCRAAGIAFHHLPIEDHGIPASFETMEEVARALAEAVRGGGVVAAHCYAGLGRSPLLIACVLIHLGLSYEDAIRAISEARGFDVPEMEQQHVWLAEFNKRRLRGIDQ